ncbi:unnamed protein product [Jaminaea pallidilutea]
MAAATATSPLVAIADVTASQLLVDSSSSDAASTSPATAALSPQPLATGDLTLWSTPSTSASLSSSSAASTNVDPSEPILLIRVAEQVFPLYKSTIFGTHDGKEEWYTFSVELEPQAGSAGKDDTPGVIKPDTSAINDVARMWVRLVLPPGIHVQSSPLSNARDDFERILISHGLLLSGIRAAGDEVGRGAAQSGEETSQQIKDAAGNHRDQTEGTNSPASFSRSSHRFAQGSSSTTASLAQYTGIASGAVSSLASSAGSALGTAYQGARTSLFSVSEGQQQQQTASTGGTAAGQDVFKGEEADKRIMPETRDAISQAFDGAGQGASSIYGTATDEAPSVISHNAGQESAEVASHAGQSLANVGSAAKDATLGTSTVVHGYYAAKGAAEEQQSK